jgi:hypothetical protein
MNILKARAYYNMHRKFFTGSWDSFSKTKIVLLILVIFLTSCQAVTSVDSTPTFASGEIRENQNTYGPYYLYLLTTPSDPPQTLVVIHGTPAKDLSAGETIFYFAEHWAPFAEEQNWHQKR